MVRYHMIFTGRVQGVGFRWQARTAAEALRLTGWVRNRWDGCVEMEIQGEEEVIDRMIEMLGRARYIYIDNIYKEMIPTNESEGSFEVKR